MKLARFACEHGFASFTGTLDSLHSFENSKELDLEYRLMVNPGAGREFDIPDSLPTSIEAISILGRSDEADQHSLFIRTLVNAKRAGLLDLKRLSHRVFILKNFIIGASRSAAYKKEPHVAYTDLCQQCGWQNMVEEPE